MPFGCKGGSGDVEERDTRLGGQGFGEEGLAITGGPVQQDATRRGAKPPEKVGAGHRQDDCLLQGTMVALGLLLSSHRR